MEVPLSGDAIKELSTAIDAYAGAVGQLRAFATNCVNESDTRFRVIDTILLTVLGWQHSEIDTERYCRETGFADYALLDGGRPLLVLEAKKSGTAFTVAGDKFPSSPVGFRFLETSSPEAARAMRQALAYATELGARYVAITNGFQWLVMLVHVAGVPLQDRSVLVFESLEAVQDRFRAFFCAFAPAGVRGSLAATLLTRSRQRVAPHKPSSKMPGYPRAAERNIIANELSTVIAIVLRGMEQEETSERFLRECYVRPTGSKAIDDARELLAERCALDWSPQIQSATVAAIEANRASHAERPLLVLGRVGHGKSTFLRYLRQVAAKEDLDRYIQIDINFLDRPDSKEQVAAFFYAEVQRQLLDHFQIDLQDLSTLRGVLESELSRFKKSPVAQLHDRASIEWRTEEVRFIDSQQVDIHAFLGKVCGYIRRRFGRPISIFFDNLDRREVGIQEEALLRASASARDWEAVVFVCLRPDTYQRSRQRGVLDSIAPRVLVVNAPDPTVLVRKRLQYAATVARGETVRGSHVGHGSASVSFDLSTAADFLACCDESFHRNRELGDLLNAAGNGSPRQILLLLARALESQHLDTRKIISKLKGGYLLPPHELRNALLYGDFWEYDPKSSMFCNVLDIDYWEPVEHFVQLSVLEFMSRRLGADPGLNSVRLEEIGSALVHAGYSRDCIEEAIRKLMQAECLEGAWREQAQRSSDSDVRLTAKGIYMVQGLIGTFQYFDAVLIDTPITDARVVFEFNNHSIDDRLGRVRDFLGYLDRCADALHDADSKNMWNHVSQRVRNDCDRVSQRARR